MAVISPRQQRLLTVEEWVQHPDADQYELIDGVLRARIVTQNQHEYTVARLGCNPACKAQRSASPVAA